LIRDFIAARTLADRRIIQIGRSNKILSAFMYTTEQDVGTPLSLRMICINILIPNMYLQKTMISKL